MELLSELQGTEQKGTFRGNSRMICDKGQPLKQIVPHGMKTQLLILPALT